MAFLPIYAYDWGGHAVLDTGGAGGGTGKPVLRDFKVTRSLDTASPALMAKFLSGEHIQSVVVRIRRPFQEGADHYVTTR